MKCLFALLALAIATPASAELIFFSEERSMSVLSHRVEGDRVIVALRGGGEMSFDRALITRIAPDEVPYTDDATAETPDPLPVARSPQLAGKTAYDPIIESAATKTRHRRAHREGGDTGRVGVSAARAIVEGRDGSHAADAQDGAAIPGA